MKKKQVFPAVLGVGVIASALAFVILRPQGASAPMTFVDAQKWALQTDEVEECLTSVNRDLEGTPTHKAISATVGAKLTNVPTGVAYGVFIDSYTEQQATGTIVYDGFGNTFNFVVRRAGSGWKLHDFQPCNEVQGGPLTR